MKKFNPEKTLGDVTKTITKRKDGSIRVQLKINGPSRTVQSAAPESDINNIMRKYQKTGLLPQIQNGMKFGDFTSVNDFHSAQQRIAFAQETFDALPAYLRKRFNNSPQDFVGFVTNPKNQKELVDLGLATATPTKAPGASSDRLPKGSSKEPPNEKPPAKPE